MSYCRWSDDRSNCDVYVYEAEDGFVTHVASRRHDIDRSQLPPEVDLVADPEGWLAGNRLLHDLMDQAGTVPIGLAHDGEFYTHDTPGECADNLEVLRAAGYRVPQYAIDALREEESEADEHEETRHMSDRGTRSFLTQLEAGIADPLGPDGTFQHVGDPDGR